MRTKLWITSFNEAKRLLEESNESIKKTLWCVSARQTAVILPRVSEKRYGAPPSAYRKNYRYMNGEE
ncbi:MAG: hypothetical protein L6V93_05925 [Clostridiales bacterium]|nr:MAG: hypothetical protein L6V93_05925 [Clostridiales bacterium]